MFRNAHKPAVLSEYSKRFTSCCFTASYTILFKTRNKTIGLLLLRNTRANNLDLRIIARMKSSIPGNLLELLWIGMVSTMIQQLRDNRRIHASETDDSESSDGPEDSDDCSECKVTIFRMYDFIATKFLNHFEFF